MNGTETKGKEKRPRLRSRIETHPPFRYFCVVPCPLFSLRAPLNLFPAFLLFPFQPASIPFAGAASKNNSNGSRFPRAVRPDILRYGSESTSPAVSRCRAEKQRPRSEEDHGVRSAVLRRDVPLASSCQRVIPATLSKASLDLQLLLWSRHWNKLYSRLDRNYDQNARELRVESLGVAGITASLCSFEILS